MAMQAQRTDTKETAELIGSDKVEGTEVYRSNGDHVGEIERVMIDKLSARPPTPSWASADSSAWARTTIRSRGSG